MSEKYPGGIIRSTPVTPAGPYQDSAASGIWTLDQATNFIKQGNWPTAGNVNPNAFIENLFSSYLYTGNGSTQTITNGIDLAGQGGLIWTKRRNTTGDNWLNDTTRGISRYISSNLSDAELGPDSNSISSVSSTGYSVGFYSGWNANSSTYVSWTFRKQQKFFDIVTWTGNGSNPRNISHNLGSTPGAIIAKNYSSSDSWYVYHRSLGGSQFLVLNGTDTATTFSTVWANTNPTSTQFTVGATLNSNGTQYVAYIFAHDAGGFGLTGAENVISCGSSFGSGTVNLGYEPQWVLVKSSTRADDWSLIDNMRGAPTPASGTTPYPQELRANTSGAETSNGLTTGVIFNSTGFIFNSDTVVGGATYVYIAIRRGPMKTPTSGTSVFSPIATSAAAGTVLTTGFPLDATMYALRNTAWTYNSTISSRLTGIPSIASPSNAPRLQTSSTDAEQNLVSAPYLVDNTGFAINPGFGGGIPVIYWNFRRSPSVFDVVCYTGTSAGSRAVAHNLGVAPEMVIVKQRTAVGGARSWWVLTTSGPRLNILNDNSAANAFGVPANLFGDATYNNYIAPTATTVTLSPSDEVNSSSNSYIMYLFASCPGVSKVGTYTGTGALQTINCGFTAGARFVLIKRTDSAGDWFTYDSARGITSSDDPYMRMNSTAAEVTGTNYVDTTSVGFQVTAAAPAGLNANGGTYIFLAIA
jgi:hypothetical protein